MTHGRRSRLLTGLLLVGLNGACAATGPLAGQAGTEQTVAEQAATEQPTTGVAVAQVAEPARELRPQRGQTYLALGARLLEANEPALAMRAFNNSLSAEGITPEALTGAGIAAQRQGMLGTAREYFEYARSLAPNSAIAHRNLGVVLLGLKDYHAARSALRSALLLSGEEGDAAALRYLQQAETRIAAREAGRHGDPAATQRVVRLGSDSFRLTEKAAPDSEDAGAAAALTGLGLDGWASDAADPDAETEPGDVTGSGDLTAAAGASATGSVSGPAEAIGPARLEHAAPGDAPGDATLAAAGTTGSSAGEPIETAGLAPPDGKGARNGTD